MYSPPGTAGIDWNYVKKVLNKWKMFMELSYLLHFRERSYVQKVEDLKI